MSVFKGFEWLGEGEFGDRVDEVFGEGDGNEEAFHGGLRDGNDK